MSAQPTGRHACVRTHCHRPASLLGRADAGQAAGRLRGRISDQAGARAKAEKAPARAESSGDLHLAPARPPSERRWPLISPLALPSSPPPRPRPRPRPRAATRTSHNSPAFRQSVLESRRAALVPARRGRPAARGWWQVARNDAAGLVPGVPIAVLEKQSHLSAQSLSDRSPSPADALARAFGLYPRTTNPGLVFRYGACRPSQDCCETPRAHGAVCAVFAWRIRSALCGLSPRLAVEAIGLLNVQLRSRRGMGLPARGSGGVPARDSSLSRQRLCAT